MYRITKSKQLIVLNADIKIVKNAMKTKIESQWVACEG